MHDGAVTLRAVAWLLLQAFMWRRAPTIPRDRSGRAGVVDQTAPEARFGRPATPALS